MPLTARETAEVLGVKLDTLYAYVSRGLLKSVEVAGSRERHYDPDEIERFRGGKRAARSRAETLMPIIPSAICRIDDHRLFYRGRDALALAETASLEEIAAILWEEEARPTPTPTLPRSRGRGMAIVGEPGAPPPPRAGEGWGGGELLSGFIERCQIRLAELSASDLAALDLTRAGVVRTGRLILGELAAAVGDGVPPAALPVHRQLASAWKLDDSGGDLVRRCLVLLADHELNASTFVARCVASTAATPYAVVLAALAALSGRRHGGASTRVEAMFRELGDAAPLPAMAARLARGDALPGLDQPLYPTGDPRARAIAAALSRARPDAGARLAAAGDAALRLTGQHPNVDFALGATSVALGLPPGAALGIFLVARSVGWIAHALEQYESGMLIRPRARYIGKR